MLGLFRLSLPAFPWHLGATVTHEFMNAIHWLDPNPLIGHICCASFAAVIWALDWNRNFLSWKSSKEVLLNRNFEHQILVLKNSHPEGAVGAVAFDARIVGIWEGNVSKAYTAGA